MKKQSDPIENIKKLLDVVEDLVEAMKVQQNMIILMSEHLDKTSEGLITVMKLMEKPKKEKKK